MVLKEIGNDDPYKNKSKSYNNENSLIQGAVKAMVALYTTYNFNLTKSITNKKIK